MLKAALLSQIHNELPCCRGSENTLALFQFGNTMDADKAPLAMLLQQARESTGIQTSWLTEIPGKTLLRLTAANLRYQAPDREALIFAALEQALRYGPSYCLCGLGDISRIFIARARTVSREIHKMLGFIRFEPAPDNTLVARPKLFHDTADLILKAFEPRYPDTCLVFLLGETALALEHGKIVGADPAAYRDYLEDSGFATVWDTYYQSQYIETRKNIRLASRCIPKKYWDWLSEGKMLQTIANE